MRHLASGMFIVLAATGAALADAKGDFDMLYGQEARKVAATAGTADDAAFAAKLVKDAKSLGDSPQLQTLVYEKAIEFGLRNPAGLPAALEALDALVKAQPDKAAEYQAIKLKALEGQYRSATGAAKQGAGQAYLDVLLERAEAEAADGKAAEADKLLATALPIATSLRSPKAAEIVAKRRSLAEATKRQAQIKQLAARIEQNPQDTAARQTLILLLEEDKPDEAAKLVTADLNEALRTYVPLAAKKVEELPEASCLDLAAWYESLPEKAAPAGKGNAMARAADCYRQYLRLHTQQDAGALKAKKALAAVEKSLGTAASGGKGKTLTVDLGSNVTMKMVLIPAGKFTMGSPDGEKDRLGNEGPQREVKITKPFYLGVTEVTQTQYEAVMGKNPSRFKGPLNPVDSVSWDDAVDFCKTLSGKTGKNVRLPTEAEWEYACRAGTKTRFTFGDDDANLRDYAWYNANSASKTHPVGQMKPNGWGLYDMLGNVWEWCEDWYAESYTNRRNVDPTGPDSGSFRVLRGGSWYNVLATCRSAFRLRDNPVNRGDSSGFRVAVGAVGVD
jgi:formylglycine-generating enzyme required for sulfatase activity